MLPRILQFPLIAFFLAVAGAALGAATIRSDPESQGTIAIVFGYVLFSCIAGVVGYRRHGLSGAGRYTLAAYFFQLFMAFVVVSVFGFVNWIMNAPVV